MRKVMVGVALVATLALAGCSAEPSREIDDDTSLFEKRITLSDGRQITCIVYDGYHAGGISCDWEGGK